MKFSSFFGNINVRYKFGGAPKIKPLKLPDPVPSIVTLEAQRVSQTGRKSQGSRFTSPGFMTPTRVERRQLRTDLG